jgi:hypothetical protein
MRTKNANTCSILDFSAENAKVADSLAEGREFELPGDFTSKSFQMRRGGDRGVRLKEPPADCRKMSMCVPPVPRNAARVGSARYVENGICSLGLVGKRLDSFVRGQNQQSDFSPARLEFHLVHHRKRSISSRADYEALALPGYFFLDRDWGMSELLPESFRELFLALANPAAVNDDVTFISNAINFDSTEVKFAEVHGKALRFKVSSVDSHPPWLGSS